MIDILLGTCNGQEYLRQQIDSILAQSFQQWRLLIRDDGSDDNTKRIIEEYVSKYPSKVTLLSDNDSRLGAPANYGRLLQHSSAEYMVFCDQDDVWLPGKVELVFNIMRHTEQLYPDKPILVHTDSKVVNADLKVIFHSLWNSQKFWPSIGNDANKVMVQGGAWGHAMMINSKARECSIPIPNDAIWYDWWIAMSVAKYGRIVYVSVPSVLYRQHGKNIAGTRTKNTRYFLSRLFSPWKQLKKFIEVRKMIRKTDFDPGTAVLVKEKVITFLIKFLLSI